MKEEIPVLAFEKDTGAFVGEFENMNKAAKKLYIRSGKSIYNQIFGTIGSTFKGTPKGIKSYKTGKRYLFEAKQKK